jgi:hypothetical protein
MMVYSIQTLGTEMVSRPFGDLHLAWRENIQEFGLLENLPQFALSDTNELVLVTKVLVLEEAAFATGLAEEIVHEGQIRRVQNCYGGGERCPGVW